MERQNAAMKISFTMQRFALMLMMSLALLSCRLVLGAEDANAFANPVLRVAKMSKPPQIDGRLDAEEWGGTASFTALAAVGGVGPYTLVPEMQQIVWNIGYDDKFIYLAMHSPHKKGTYPVARCKANDDMGVLFEDHVEIQICPHARKEATRPGKGFYKMMVNPKGFMIDQYLYNGTVGTEELWSTGGETKCLVTEEFWDLEMSIEIARLGVQKLDGRSLVIQLVRTDWCGGVYFAGWAPCAWLEWNKFAEVSFDPAAPVFQFSKAGEVMAGDLDAVINLKGSAPEARDVQISVQIDNAEGKTVYSEKQAASVKAGENKTVSFKKSGIPISSVNFTDKGRNFFEMRAVYKDGPKEIVLFHNRQPFVKLDDAYREKYLKPWLDGRPQSGEWEYRIAYLPYCNRAEAGVDLDFFGIPAEIAAAKSFSVEIRRKGDNKALASGKAEIKEMSGSAFVAVPELEDGIYEAVFALLDVSGSKKISEKTAEFERKHYPFERNKLGINDEVIPPFTPMAVKDLDIMVWGRTYSIGKGGLPERIKAGPPTGCAGVPEELLAAPIRLEVQAGGKTLAAEGGEAKIASSAGHRVEVEGVQQVGPLSIKVNAFGEYDGWYEVKMEISGQKAKIDALDMLVDLADLPCDTIYVQRMGDGRYGNRFGGIDSKNGVQFKSTDLLKVRSHGKDWKSFVPQTYLGNGDKGLWFFAWSDTGWELKDGQPMLTVERLDKGVVRARVRLLAGPVEIEKRILRFALQAAPVKPNDKRYRTRLDEDFIAHDTSGYRYYGDSVDGYALHSEEDYKALRKFLIYGPRYQNAESAKQYCYWRTDWFAGAPRTVMYGSTWMAGSGAPEFKTFGGEWFGKSNWKPSPDTTFTDKFNYQGTVQWKTQDQLAPNGNNWTQSHTDFFIWYHKPLIEKCGFNGTWWDNSSIGTVREYDPELDAMDSKWNLYARRQLCKRLNHLGWELARPPCWAMNLHVDMPFNQIFWMVENDWYADAEDMTAPQHWKLEEYRAMCRTKSTTLISNPWYSGFSGTTPEMDRKVKRSVWGMMLSHDVIAPVAWNTPPEYAALRRKLQYAMDISDVTRCLFTGYWASAKAVQPAGKDVKASFYSNKSMKTALVIFYNTDRQDQYLAGTTFDVSQLIDPSKRLSAKRIYDLESGRDLVMAFEDGRYRINEPFLAPWHEFRLLAVEAE